MNRNDFAGLVVRKMLCLELSPFTAPVLRGGIVEYADVLDTDSLVVRAGEVGYNKDEVVPVNHVIETNGGREIGKKFDVVLSCHVIEHQPNLLGHLSWVAKHLRRNGVYMLVIPDKRYCFDHFIAESTVAQVIEASYRNGNVHTIQSLIEHRAHTTHNDPVRHWAGDHGEKSNNLVTRVRDAIDEFDYSAGGYIDVHSWYFSPDSFVETIQVTKELGFHRFEVKEVFQTEQNAIEFFVILGTK